MDKGFIYDKEHHIGTYKGKVIPSITQLIAMKYSLDGVDSKVLEKASALGTEIHKDIELYVNGLGDCQTNEGKNFTRLTKLLDLNVLESEKQVFIYDENDNIIAYGTLDLLLEAKSDIAIDDKPLLKKGELILGDIKRVSAFDNEKVSLQTSLYAWALEQDKIAVVDKVAGFWLKEDIAQYRPLNLIKGAELETIFYDLLNKWKGGND